MNPEKNMIMSHFSRQKLQILYILKLKKIYIYIDTHMHMLRVEGLKKSS